MIIRKLNISKTLLSFCCIAIAFIIVIICFNTFNLKNVIISGPIQLNFKFDSDYNVTKQVKIIGLSPTGKQHIFTPSQKNFWDYSDYSNFKSIYIISSEPIANFKEINIETKYSNIAIKDYIKPLTIKLKYDFTLDTNHNYPMIYVYNLSKNIKGEISSIEILKLMLKWRDIKVLLVMLFLSFVFLLIMFTFIKSKKTRNVASNIILTCYYKLKEIKPKYYLFLFSLLIFLLHLGFYFLFGLIIKTTGLIVMIVLFTVLYITTKEFLKYFKISKQYRELKLVFISTGFTFCLIEFILLLSGFTDTYIEKRNNSLFYNSYYNKHINSWYYINDTNKNDLLLQSSEFCYHRSSNSFGLTDKEHPIIKEENEYRIIGLGDSFTEGDGAHADSTWMKFLERNLSELDINNNLTFMNAGVCGSDPFFEYVLLRDKLLQYKPDLVILAINRSEIHDIVIRGGWERFLNNGDLKYNDPPWWEPIFASSRISRLLFYALGYNDMLYKHNDNTIKDAANTIVDVLYAFNNLATKNRFHLIIVFHPVNFEIYNNEMELGILKDSLKTITTFDILDMLEYFTNIEGIDSSNSINYYWPKDGHHNAKGYEAFARGVEWHLKTNGILDSLTVENNY